MVDEAKYVANPAQGVSFGLELPFMYRQEDQDHWIVYQRKDGLIVATFDGSEAMPESVWQKLDGSQKAFWARELAFQDCIKRNKAEPDLASIDSTP